MRSCARCGWIAHHGIPGKLFNPCDPPLLKLSDIIVSQAFRPAPSDKLVPFPLFPQQLLLLLPPLLLLLLLLLLLRVLVCLDLRQCAFELIVGLICLCADQLRTPARFLRAPFFFLRLLLRPDACECSNVLH